MKGITERITRQWILERVSQESIFAEYLGITVAEIYDCVTYNKTICNPLRTDHTPTAGFYFSYDRLRFHDFAGYFHGDCFDVVGYTNFLDADDPREHNMILEIVAKRFGLIAGDTQHSILNGKISPIIKDNMIFDPIARNWEHGDYRYWKEQYEVSYETLALYHTVPLYQLYINKVLVYTYDRSDPGYAYYIGPYDNRPNWKIYFPMRKKYKFLANTRKMDGLHLVKPAPYGLIIKSRKCAMTLHQFDVPMAIMAGEGMIPTVKEMAFLRSNWPVIYSLTDFDKAGRFAAIRMRRTYGTIPLFLTNGYFGSLDFFDKDISDHMSTQGYYRVKELINYLKENGIELTNDFIDFYKWNYGIEEEETNNNDIPFFN